MRRWLPAVPFVVLCCIAQSASAQQAAVDSLDRLLAVARQDTATIKLRIERAWALTAYDLDGAIAEDQAILQASEEAKYLNGRRQALAMIARTQAVRGRREEALATLDRLDRLAAASRDSLTYGEAAAARGSVAAIAQDNAEAIRLLTIGVSIIERQGGSRTLAANYGALGIAYQVTGNFSAALRCMRTATRLAQADGDVRQQATTLMNSAAVYTGLRDTARSNATYREAIGLAERAGLQRVAIYAYSNLAGTYYDGKDWEKVSRYATKAAALAKDAGEAGIRAASLSRAGVAEAMLSRFENSERFSDEAIATALAAKQPYVFSQVYSGRGELLKLQKQYAGAIPDVRTGHLASRLE